MSSTSTERRFLDSTLAAYGSMAVRLVVAFATRAILARLVLPEAHGVYELALRTVIVVSAVRDLGLPFHLMRDPRKPYGTVLAFSLASGVVFTLGLVLAAPLFGGIDPDLPGVLRVFSLWVILDAFVAVPKAFFDRELQIGRLFLPEVARGLVVAAVAVPMAWQGFGVWSFIGGDLAALTLFAGLVWRRAWREMPRKVDPELIPDLLRRSVWLFTVWIVYQVFTYVDAYVVQAFSTTAMVGQYSRAFMIAFLVPQIAAPRALLPALMEYRGDPERFFGAFRFGTVFLLSLQAVGAYFLFFAAEKVVLIILGEGWEPARDLLRILCFVPLVAVFDDLGGAVLKVRNEDRLWLVVMSANALSLIGVGVLLASRMGAAGMAWANYALVGSAILTWRVWNIFGAPFRQLARDVAFVYLAPLPFFLLAGWLTEPDGWPRFAAAAGAAAAGLGVLVYRFLQPFRRFFLPE